MSGNLAQQDMFGYDFDVPKEITKLKNKTDGLFGRYGILDDIVEQQGKEIEEMQQILRDMKRKTP